MEGVPRDLREELVVAGRCSPVEARCDAGRPVAFCYADRTESLWDISIEMLEEYRRQGHATRCVVYMIQHLRPLRPIGAPEETNLASLRLTAKLGFVPVNKLPVFHALLRSSC
jgi:hypothetical protein